MTLELPQNLTAKEQRTRLIEAGFLLDRRFPGYLNPIPGYALRIKPTTAGHSYTQERLFKE